MIAQNLADDKSTPSDSQLPDQTAQPTLYKVCINLTANLSVQGKQAEAMRILSMVQKFTEDQNKTNLRPSEVSQFRNNMAVMMHRSDQQPEKVYSLLRQASDESQKAIKFAQVA